MSYSTTYQSFVWPIPLTATSSTQISGELDQWFVVAGSVADKPSPPFPASPRSLEISIRIEDPRSRQIRQLTVTEDF
ncbi:MAG: hypothetical protein R3C05_17295 [Pirellulaceae bacterium]